MHTRLSFKLIALLITLSLAGLVAFQGYWLKGLYDTLYIQLENNVKEAMKMADYQELIFRIQQVKKKRNTERQMFTFSSEGPDSLLFENKNAQDSLRSANNSRLDISFQYDDDDNLSLDSTLNSYLQVFNHLEKYVHQGLHHQIDSLEPLNFDRYYYGLKEELHQRGIDTPFELFVHYEEDKQIKATMYLGKYKKNKHFIPDSLSRDSLELLNLPPSPAYPPWKNTISFDYPILSQDAQYFRLYLKSPTQVVLSQMYGILASSVSLFILIIIAFVYLLRTILHQKTVEELKTDFTNNMTHELKTPISVSYSAIDALLNFSNDTNEKQRKYLTIVKEQLVHLTGLVEQILTLAVENRSTFRLHPEPIAVAPLIETLVQQYRLKASSNVRFTTSVPPNLTVTADRTHLYNMLSNLIENAIKYTEGEDCRIVVSAEATSQQVCISVTDNGIGISEAHQKHIFEKFYRVPNGNLHNVKGYGLGLYYVRNMMDKHHGTIRLKSAPGKGAAFTLCFKIKTL